MSLSVARQFATPNLPLTSTILCCTLLSNSHRRIHLPPFVRDKYGDEFDAVKERTSIVPFQVRWLHCFFHIRRSLSLLESYLLLSKLGRSEYSRGRQYLDDSCDQQSFVCPGQAILEGRQELPSNYWKEFARGPYFVIVGEGTLV